MAERNGLQFAVLEWEGIFYFSFRLFAIQLTNGFHSHNFSIEPGGDNVPTQQNILPINCDNFVDY
jgi:hypothetical protein